jgi:hypothetical protein
VCFFVHGAVEKLNGRKFEAAYGGEGPARRKNSQRSVFRAAAHAQETVPSFFRSLNFSLDLAATSSTQMYSF